jgi:glycosyltransferase involved in cell wall biosynthesis
MYRKILIVCDHFEPGYKGGGPIRAISGIISKLAEDFEFYILSSDRDLNADSKYPDIVSDTWIKRGTATVYYASPGSLGSQALEAALNLPGIELIYLTSFFSKLARSLFLKVLLGRITVPVVVSPRGQLTDKARSLKAWKKRPFINLFKWSGLPSKISWHVTSEQERADLIALFGSVKTYFAENIANGRPTDRVAPGLIGKSLRLVYFGRISPKKNLHYSLEILRSVRVPVTFDVIGPHEDLAYSERCMNLAKLLPTHISVNFLGAKTHLELELVLPNYHGFFFPTLSENFGYAIVEALLGGLVPIISDQTYWNFLSDDETAHIVPLKDKDLFRDVIESLASSTYEEISLRRRKAIAAGAAYVRNAPGVEKHRSMFNAELLNRQLAR